MIDGLTNAGALPVLERLMQFAGRRHEVIANNIANLNTPDFQPTDVSVEGFQAQLREAVEARRDVGGKGNGGLELEDTEEISVSGSRMELHPQPMGEGILQHDGNDRNVEKIMQDMVENFMAFRAAAQFMRFQTGLINSAIAERVS